jgi:hypothetical protein
MGEAAATGLLALYHKTNFQSIFHSTFHTMAKKNGDSGGALTPAGDAALVRKLARQAKAAAKSSSGPPSATKLRLMDAAAAAAQPTDLQNVMYQHSVFCQAGLPYRDPGDETTEWQLDNGSLYLLVTAGKVLHNQSRQWVRVGIPWGTKPRLILGDWNTQAILKQSPELDLEKTLTRFVKRLELAPHGRNINSVKNAITRLCAADIKFGLPSGDTVRQVNTQLMGGFELWFPKDDRQRVLWPTWGRLSLDYFQILMEHGVPLDESAYIALSHSAMAMDIYAWLAQRLHRVKPGSPSLVTWPNLHQQFGWHYDRLRKFREVFLTALRQVQTVYPSARFEWHEGGLVLRNSPPPITKPRVMISGFAKTVEKV